MSVSNMQHSIIEIMKKSGSRGRHKWKWHKETERAVISLVVIANTKASGETLIEATEWHEQSNWISSAVSSNLIWPALWRMTGERNAFPCPPLPLGVPHTRIDPQTCRLDNWPTSAAWAASAQTAPLPVLPTSSGQPPLHSLHTLCAPCPSPK